MNWEAQIGKRFSFTATFVGAGQRYMLLGDVRHSDGALFRRHLWLRYTRRFRKQRLRSGDRLCFQGKVNRYYKRADEDKGLPWYAARRVPDLEITNIYLQEKGRMD